MIPIRRGVIVTSGSWGPEHQKLEWTSGTGRELRTQYGLHTGLINVAGNSFAVIARNPRRIHLGECRVCLAMGTDYVRLQFLSFEAAVLTLEADA
jgi:hypothetical protein